MGMVEYIVLRKPQWEASCGRVLQCEKLGDASEPMEWFEE